MITRKLYVQLVLDLETSCVLKSNKQEAHQRENSNIALSTLET